MPTLPITTPNPSLAAMGQPVAFPADAGLVQRARETQQVSAPPAATTVPLVVRQISEALHAPAQNVEFDLDRESGKIIVRVISEDTRKVIRQIPSEEALAIAHALDRMQGLFLEEKA